MRVHQGTRKDAKCSFSFKGHGGPTLRVQPTVKGPPRSRGELPLQRLRCIKGTESYTQRLMYNRARTEDEEAAHI